MYDSLALREVFHLEFLRWFGRKIKQNCYAVKGGTNLRLFFKSFRYSEDMDIDVVDIGVVPLQDVVMQILKNSSFQDILKTFEIERIVPPDILKAKQTRTTQRFKVHLITPSGEDLFTKIEFSHRGINGKIIVGPVSDSILRVYKMPPLLVAHYNVQSTAMQKITALAGRAVIQARDIFDLYILSSQFDIKEPKEIKLRNNQLQKAYENIFEINFEQFRDTVVLYLSAEDQSIYNSSDAWDEVKLKAANFIDELRR